MKKLTFLFGVITCWTTETVFSDFSLASLSCFCALLSNMGFFAGDLGPGAENPEGEGKLPGESLAEAVHLF
jgi:hypothetical protein